MNDQEYFELLRNWIKEARDDETAEYGHHPCAPHEQHERDDCPELCQCGHTCRNHVYLNGQNLYGPKPTAYICVEPKCDCKMFADKKE